MDLTLSDSFSWLEQEIDKIILGESVPHKQVQKDEFVLEPNHFVLSSTEESIRVPHDLGLMWSDIQVSDARDCRYKMRIFLMQDFTDK